MACDDDDWPRAFGRCAVCFAVALVAGVDVYGLKLLCCPDICLTDLQAPHTVVDNEFFSVQCVHTQNSPLRSVSSSMTEMLFSFEPPHTTHVVACAELTSVHFLHVQAFRTGKSTVSSELASSSVRSGSTAAIGMVGGCAGVSDVRWNFVGSARPVAACVWSFRRCALSLVSVIRLG